MLGTYFPIYTPSLPPSPLLSPLHFVSVHFPFSTFHPFFVFQLFVLLFSSFIPSFFPLPTFPAVQISLPLCLFSSIFSFDFFPNSPLLCFISLTFLFFFVFNLLFLASHVYSLLFQSPSLRLRFSFILAFSVFSFLRCPLFASVYRIHNIN